MTTKAKPITLLINSVDYSQYLIKAEVGYDSYSQGTGLILKKGSITIASISGGRALDPRDNNDFQVGNIVNIYYNVSLASPTAPHPIATVTRILAPPSVSPIESDLPVLEGNLLLEIPIGCELAYFKTKQADAEATGVTYGNPLNAQNVIRNLLLKAGISGASIETSSIARFNIDFPYNKNGGSFIDLAGEFAYSTSEYFLNPSVLYCDRNNIIREKLIKVKTATYPLTITLGLNDREYLPQIDQSIAPGIVNISGIKREVVDNTSEYPFTSSGITAASGITTIVQTTHYKNLREDDTISNNPAPIGQYIPNVRLDFSARTEGFLRSLRKNYVYLGSVTITTTNGSVTGQEILFTFFSNGRLSYTLSINWAPIGSFYNFSDSEIFLWWRKQLICSQYVYVGYSYSADELVTLKETLTFKAPGVVNKSRETFNSDTEVNTLHIAFFRENVVRLTNVRRESWATKGKDFVYSESNYNAAGLDNPQIEDDDEFFKLVPGRKTTTTNRETSIPATEYAEDPYSETESIINSSVTFGKGTNVKQYDIQLPFAWTDAQLDAIGIVEGTIINGRQYQYLIECDPDLLESYQEPLFGLRVIEPTKLRYFLCDALSWVHTDTEDYVGMAGIYMGSRSSSISVSQVSSTSAAVLRSIIDALEASIPMTVSQSMIGVQESSGSIVFGGHSIQSICTGVCY